jgi:hypothetical protein
MHVAAIEGLAATERGLCRPGSCVKVWGAMELVGNKVPKPVLSPNAESYA